MQGLRRVVAAARNVLFHLHGRSCACRPAMVWMALGLACCGSGPPGPAPAPDACETISVPRQLPPVSAVVDSGALVRDVAGVTFSAREKSLVLSIVYSSSGSPSIIRVFGSEVDDHQTARVLAAVRRRARTQAAGDAWGARLRIEAGANPSVGIERAEFCEAVLHESSLKGDRGDPRVSSRSRVRAAFRNLRGSNRLRIAVAASGEVGDVLDAEFGGRINGIVYYEILHWRFRPGLVDGVPVESSVVMTRWRLRQLTERIR